MVSTDIVALFRSDMADVSTPPLWTDNDAYGYLDDAQKQFCRLTEGIEDSRTNPVCQLSIRPTVEWYAKSPLILKVRGAARVGDGRPVAVINIEQFKQLGKRTDGASGPLTYLIDGQSKGYYRAYPVPNETVTVELSVFRLPLAPITNSGTDQVLEVDDQHHRHLVLWMRHLGYSKHDSDTYDAKAAAEYEERFNAYCARAKAEQERARRQIGAVAYGGIPMTNSGTGYRRSFPNDYGRPI